MVFNRNILSLLLMFASFLSVEAGNKRALVIGIGQYGDSRWEVIHGDTDVDYAVALLQANGFNDIKTLKNQQATKQAIINELRSLERRCSEGDKVYIHFSGHGQQITDLDGDEDDGWDEAWIPFDAQPAFGASYKGENHLVDDEVNEMLSSIRSKIGSSGRILVVLDACHSETAARGESDDIARGFDEKFVIEGVEPANRRPAPAPEQWITISACRSYQINWEIKNPAPGHTGYFGRLTWCMYYLKDRLGKLDNDSLRSEVVQIMKRHPGVFEQTPSFTGCLGEESIKEVFN